MGWIARSNVTTTACLPHMCPHLSPNAEYVILSFLLLHQCRFTVHTWRRGRGMLFEKPVWERGGGVYNYLLQCISLWKLRHGGREKGRRREERRRYEIKWWVQCVRLSWKEEKRKRGRAGSEKEKEREAVKQSCTYFISNLTTLVCMKYFGQSGECLTLHYGIQGRKLEEISVLLANTSEGWMCCFSPHIHFSVVLWWFLLLTQTLIPRRD